MKATISEALLTLKVNRDASSDVCRVCRIGRWVVGAVDVDVGTVVCGSDIGIQRNIAVGCDQFGAASKAESSKL